MREELALPGRQATPEGFGHHPAFHGSAYRQRSGTGRVRKRDGTWPVWLAFG